MHVRNFEADSLDEALKSIKKELGPDAIILKTITNKGIKGAFKKKVQVTAGVTTKDYEKKSKVDNVLNDEQKENFYSNKASEVNSMIDSYNHSSEKSGYGKVALNKAVKTVKSAQEKMRKPKESGLEHFLNEEKDFVGENGPLTDELEHREVQVPERKQRSHVSFAQEATSYQSEEDIAAFKRDNELLREELRFQKNKIESLENKLKEVLQTVKNINPETNDEGKESVRVLSQTLKTLDIDQKIITDICKKAFFELGEEIDDDDVVFDFALRKLSEIISVSLPSFSAHPNDTGNVVALISEGATGQSSFTKKLASTIKAPAIVQLIDPSEQVNDFAAKMLGLPVYRVRTSSELVSKCRELKSGNYNIIVDINSSLLKETSAGSLVKSLERNFSSVETLLSLSAIHSSIYNKKTVKKYETMVNGLVVNQLDQCLNFGALINLQYETKVPYVFYGTGVTVPDDMEAASAERIIGMMFNLT